MYGNIAGCLCMCVNGKYIKAKSQNNRPRVLQLIHNNIGTSTVCPNAKENVCLYK